MKKLVSLVLVAVMLVCGAVVYAEGIDLSAMTEEQLVALIDDARLALVKFHPSAVDGTVLYEDESVRLILVGAPEINEYDNLTLRVIVENMTDHNLMVSLENLSCNGWSISDDSISVPAKKKAKEIFEFYDAVTDAEIEKAEDVQDIEGSLYYFDTDTYDTLLEPVHFSWIF